MERQISMKKDTVLLTEGVVFTYALTALSVRDSEEIIAVFETYHLNTTMEFKKCLDNTLKYKFDF